MPKENYEAAIFPLRKLGIYDTYITGPEYSDRNLPALIKAGGIYHSWCTES